MGDPAAHATQSVRVPTARAAGYVVRPVERADLGSVARVHVQVWREAYSSLLSVARRTCRAATGTWGPTTSRRG